MEENEQTEQTLELDNAQLAQVTGGVSVLGMDGVNLIMHRSPENRSGLLDTEMAHELANGVQRQIRKTITEKADKSYGGISKGWTKPLRKGKA
jgi:hypothetical protein